MEWRQGKWYSCVSENGDWGDIVQLHGRVAHPIDDSTKNVIYYRLSTREWVLRDKTTKGAKKMIEIPNNTTVNDTKTLLEKAISAVLTDPRFEKFGFSNRIKVNHGSATKEYGEVWVRNKIADEIVRRFKDKGYYAHYCHSIKGIAYELTITKYPTNNDI